MKRLLLLLALTIGASVAVADIRDEADLLFEMGNKAFARAQYAEALQYFLASNRLAPNRNVLFNIAFTYEQLERFPEAFRYYSGALEGETDSKARADLQKALSRIAPRVGVVDVISTPPGARVFIGRRELGSAGITPARLGVTGGKMLVFVEADGYEPAAPQEVSVATGASITVTFDLVRIVGTVKLTSEAGVLVRADDDKAGIECTTPCELKLSPGQHVLYFSREGFTTEPRAVAVEAGATRDVPFAMQAQTGTLLVSTDERNALIEIDGHAVGFAPTVIQNVRVGRRKVRVSLRGFEPIEQDVDIVPGQQFELRDLRMAAIRRVAAASRASESIDDAPASVTVISGQEMEAFAYPTILEALRGVRGMAVNYDSIYGNASVRGLGQANDYNNRLLVLSDGAVLNENILYQPFIHYDGRTDLGDVDRIEIVRGAGSVLYGTGAVSGVINLVPRDLADEPAFHAQASAVDHSTARLRVGASRSIGKGKIALSLAAARSDGRTDDLGDALAPLTVSGLDKFASGTANLRGQVGWLHLQAFYTARRITTPTGWFGSELNDRRQSTDDRRLLLEVRAEPKISDKFSLLARAYANQAFFDMQLIFADVDDAGDPTEAPYGETYNSTWGGLDVRARIAATKGLDVTVGGEVTLHTKAEMLSFDGNSASDGELLLNVNEPYKVFSGYALADYRRAKLRAQLGARLDRWDASQDFTALSPRLAVIYKPSSAGVLKVMGGRAFRAPSVYEYFYTDFGITQVTSDCCGTVLRPETVYSGEVEYSHKLGYWTLLGSTWGTIAQNIMESALVPDDILAANGWEPGTTYYKNSEVDQRMLGADLEARREWRGGTMVQGHVGTMFANYATAPNEDSAELRIPNAPRIYAAGKASTTVVPNLVQASARVTFEDQRRINNTTSTLTRRAFVGDLVLSGRVPAAGLRYAVGIYNVLNWRYSLAASPFVTEQMPQAGRTFMLTLSYEN